MKANEEFLHWDELQPILDRLFAAMTANDPAGLRKIITGVDQIGWREPDGNGSGA